MTELIIIYIPKWHICPKCNGKKCIYCHWRGKVIFAEWGWLIEDELN